MAGGNHVFDTDELFARGAIAGTGNLCLFNFLNQYCDQSSVEWKLSFEARVNISDTSQVNGG